MKSTTFKCSCCKFNIIGQSIKECSFEPRPPILLEAYLIGNTCQARKNEEAKAYNKVLDESPIAQGQNFNTLRT